MLSTKQREAILRQIRDMEKSTAADEAGTPIGMLCRQTDERSAELLKSNDSIAPILRTALVINWPEKAMKQRYEMFRKDFPEIDCLHRLQEELEKTDALQFCELYLNIKANRSNPERNPKYALLRTLTDGFLEYQRQVAANTEIDALRKWATRVNLHDLKNDPIGSKRGVGPGVVENIRLNLGYHVIKPDRHVIGVIRRVLKLDIQPENYVQLAAELGMSPRYLDCVLFRYGKVMSISDN